MDRDRCRFHSELVALLQYTETIPSGGEGGGRRGLIFEGKCIFENKPPPQSRSCLLLNKGVGGGAYFREDTVYELIKIINML